jgi:hypothetical protein
MPIDQQTIDLAKDRVRDDILGGFEGILSADGNSAFSIDLKDSGLDDTDVVAASESVVVVPWRYRCVHTGTFLEIPPTYVRFELTGTTFVNVGLDTWVFHRFIDFLCALHHIGVSTSVRPALDGEEYRQWNEDRHGPAD